MIHGFIPTNQASHYWNDLKTGSIVRLDWTVLKFYVRTHVQDHGASVHVFMICFIPSTRFGEVLADAPVIKSDRLMV